MTAEALAERLTLAGLEVEALEPWGGYDRMVAGRIVGLEPHPSADRLSICTVDVGREGTLRAVSGAPNLEAGLRVPVALPGARLADGTRVEATEIRGAASLAVLLSEREIGISEDHSGVMQLGPDAEPGTELSTLLETRDTILEISVTPNRGDCLSILGIARDLSALTGERLRIPKPRLSEKAPAIASRVSVEIVDTELCGRYVARLVTGVKVGPSPLWMRSRLESLGVRPINDVVDVTNYVMLERGQPMHAFDLARLAQSESGGVTIRVRRAESDRRLATLDKVERALAPDDLVIADLERPIAIAGVMGGDESAVTEATTDVLLESAFFRPSTVRRTSRRLGLRSESSMRFERTTDIEGAAAASDRAAELLQKVGRGQVATGRVDAYPHPAAPAEVLVRSERANRLLGASFPPSEIGQSLRRVSESVKAAGRGGYLCRPPSYRSDLTREADFIEEIARLGGYDRIEPTRPLAALGGGGERASERGRELGRRMRELLCAQGMTEMSSPRFVAAEWNARFPGLAPGEALPIRLLNPIANDASEMRQSLLPNLLAAARRNRHQGEPWIRGFEIGTVFWSTRGETQERQAVGGVLRGPIPPRGVIGEDRSESFYDAKGAVEALLAGLRVGPAEWRRDGSHSFLHPGKSASIRAGGERIGFCGGLHPDAARAADLEGDTWVFELDFKKLGTYASRRVGFQPLPKYPAIVRDLAIVADESFEAQAVLDKIAECSELPIDQAALFDHYRGSPLPAGKKSLAYRVSYRAADRTLTDDEVNRLHQRLTERLTRELGVELRA